MTSNCDAVKIFWPSHLCSPKSQQGFLIGWYNAKSSICVASIVPSIHLSELQDILDEFCVSGEHLEYIHINKVCNVPPQILGIFMTEESQRDDKVSLSTEQDSSVWLKVALNDAYVPVPLIMSIDGEKPNAARYEVVFYEQPNPKQLQFLALYPLELDISSTFKMSKYVPVLDKKQQEEKNNLVKIIDYAHAMNGDIEPVSDNIGAALAQINSSYFLEHGISVLAHDRKLKRVARYPALDQIAALIKSASDYLVLVVFTSPKGFIGFYIKKFIVIASMCLLFLILVLAEVTLFALSFRLPKFVLNGVALKDLFAGGQQIDLRLQQLFFWPRQYMMLRKQNWANTAKTRAYYINFYNSMWLVANDVIIGLAIGSFLMANNTIVAHKLHKILQTYTVESLQSMMIWFHESPAGLKLNHELGSFLSELFLWLIRLWTLSTRTVEPFTPQIIYIIGLSGVFGVTMVVSLLSDFLALMTLHVYCFYMVAARIFNWQLAILNSLFNLFRGKKRNILRNRIDSCDYDLDQLLLGTSLFTLLTFLFPTVLIYYLTFALGRVGVIFLQAIMETILAFFNHFPLFAIMLRLKDPHRLPGGLEFEIFNHNSFLLQHHGILHRLKQAWNKFMTKPSRNARKNSTKKAAKKRSTSFNIPSLLEKNSTGAPVEANASKGAYLWIRNMPIPLGAIFFQYMLLWKRLSAHYFSAYVFNCLLYGEPIKPIPKLQYPMLPDKRPSVSSLWQTLKLNLWDSSAKKQD